MIEVEITNDIIEEAKLRADVYKNKLTKSIRNGEGTYIGIIGELLFSNLIPKAEFVGEYNYDFILNGKTFDIKTKDRNVKPKPYYECTVNADTMDQKTDYYVFISLNLKEQKGYILGITNKNYFIHNSIYIRKGDVDPSNNFRAHSNIRNIRIDQLGEMNEFLRRL
jgi:hypothetical protein